MDLTGIENEAEFFPAGTLSDVLHVELQDITSRWSRELEGVNPVTRLSGVSDEYTRLYRTLLNTTDKATRNNLYSQLLQLMADALGYAVQRRSEVLALDEASLAMTLHKSVDAEGKQALWILESPTPDAGDEQIDPLSQTFDSAQFTQEEADSAELDKSIEELLGEGVFGLSDAPRFVLIASASQWVLIDQRKWPARSVLRFDLQEIFSRQDKDTLKLMACLIAKEARVPVSGVPLSDKLEEEAQRNANLVTSSLKSTVRDAIELLGQEVLDVTEGKFPTGPKRGVWIDGPTLSLECLRYMYRMLFLLYAESNPRLRILDLKDPLYANGYSIEALRDLESVRLRTPQEKNGTFLWESLQQTLNMMYDGEAHVLKLPAVKVSLLDPQSTPLLNSVKLRNETVQKIIRLLSLRTDKKSTGRISYAKLGIGQLGAVYETLISFTGTVCKEDMIEIKGDVKDRAAKSNDAVSGSDNADDSDDVLENAELDDFGDDEFADEAQDSRVDKVNLLAPTYFVPRRRIKEFNPESIVFAGTQAKIYPKGSFTYRLAGRDREKTAAYYTPEPLARLLVKHLLMERCKDLSADELLELKILEPAMGSAAFLVETTNQLADLYLERKQAEVGKVIPQEHIILEKQKVRSFIADRNCFGVDLNPTAVELGAISLWLNGLHKGDFSPWFGDQLHAGNSLIGVRKAVYAESHLKGKTANLWFKHPPEELGWKKARPAGSVYQWLLPAEDMANFDKDKSVKALAGEHQERIKAWRKAGFFKPLQPHEISLVKRLSEVVDELFAIVADELAFTRDSANDEITIWPDKVMSGVQGVGYQNKANLVGRLTGEDGAHNTLPFKRLKTAMDAWCALWLWPIQQADKLPSRSDFFEGMRILLEGGFSADGSVSAGEEDGITPLTVTGDLFGEVAEVSSPYNLGLFQETNVEAFIEEFEWLKVATDVAKEARFVHYDLIFADILKLRGGFDLIVGNPPWAKPTWNEALILGDLDPLYAGLKADEAKGLVLKALSNQTKVTVFLEQFSKTRGEINFTSSSVNNPFISGGSNNLYRCFMDLSFRLTSLNGFSALIHQDGHLNDPYAGILRSHWYKRIVKHFEFTNRLASKLFSEVNSEKWFSLNIYRGCPKEVEFEQFTSAFLPSQIDDSYSDLDGKADVPGKRDESENWDTRGHKERLIKIDLNALHSINELSEKQSTPIYSTRFIQPFSNSTIQLFKKLSSFRKVSEVLVNEKKQMVWQMSPYWNETSAKKNGFIKADTNFHKYDEQIIQGSIIHAANPFFKTPRRNCKNTSDYDVIDHRIISNDYIPRTNFTPRLSTVEYSKKITKCSWDNNQLHSDFYRLAMRRRVALNGERSLISAIIPPKVLHINSIESFATSSIEQLLNRAALDCSIIMDMYVKASGLTDLFSSDIERFPHINVSRQSHLRVLKLNCLTEAYAPLWEEFIHENEQILWTKLHDLFHTELSSMENLLWSRKSALRSEYFRRQALIENDVLISLKLGLNLKELTELYRLYFPVIQKNERGTWYDQAGNIVWTVSSALGGVGYLNEKGKSPGRKEWEALLATNPSELVCTAIDDTTPDGPKEVERRFVGPFFQCDRIEDYKRAWAHFEKLEQEGKL